jgi:phage FluMu gp28-like protein
LKEIEAPLYLGWDVARKDHLSSVWINAKVGDRFKHVALINMRRMPFPFMRAVVGQAMKYCRAGRGDATGLGMESCEALAREFPGRFEGVNFSSGKKEICVRMMQVYQDGRQVLSKHESDVVHDVHGIQKEDRGEVVRFHETKNPENKHSHCDMAYANGLALHAESYGVSVPGIVTAGSRDDKGPNVFRQFKRMAALERT